MGKASLFSNQYERTSFFYIFRWKSRKKKELVSDEIKNLIFEQESHPIPDFLQGHKVSNE